MSTVGSAWLDRYVPHLEAASFLRALGDALPPVDESDADAIFRSLLAPFHDLELTAKIWSTAFADASGLLNLRTTPETAFDFAVQRIRKSGEVTPSEAATLADACFRLGWTEASELASAVAHLAGDRSARTLVLLIGKAVREGASGEAKALLAEGAARYADDPEFDYSAALLELSQERLEETRDRLSQLTRAHPEFEPGWRLLADVLLLESRWKEAAQVARGATRLFPFRADLWERLSRAERGRGRIGEALAAVRRAVGAAEQSVGLEASDLLRLRLMEAELSEACGRTDEALKIYRRLLRSGHDGVEVFLAAGECLARSGQTEAGAELLAEALVLHPGQADLLTGRGRLLFELRRDAEAFATLQEAVECDPGRTSNLLLMGAIALRGRRFDLAAELASAVAQVDDARRVDALVLLGDAHRFQGAGEAAAEAYGEAERLAPGRPDVRQRLQATEELRRA